MPTINHIVMFNVLLWVVFPSTSLFLVKLLFLFLFFVFPFLVKKEVYFDKKSISLLVLSISILVFLPLYSEILSNSDGLDSTVVIRNTVIIILFVYMLEIYICNRLVKYENYFRYVVYGSLIYALAKLTIFILILIGVLNSFTFLPALGDLIPGMVHQIFPGGGVLYRLASSSDIIVTIAYCFYLIKPKLISFKNSFYLISFHFLSLFVIIQSYTRFLWLLLFICVLYKIFLSIKKPLVILSLVLLSVLSSYYIYDNIDDEGSPVSLIVARFNDTHSLDIKRIQSEKLLGEFYKHPILGKGSGSYVPGYVRDERQKYQYENQIVASLMQFGILGLLFLLFFPSCIIFKLIFFSKGNDKYIFPLLFFLFILSGFSNPNLTIISSCFIYSMFFSYRSNLS